MVVRGVKGFGSMGKLASDALSVERMRFIINVSIKEASEYLTSSESDKCPFGNSPAVDILKVDDVHCISRSPVTGSHHALGRGRSGDYSKSEPMRRRSLSHAQHVVETICMSCGSLGMPLGRTVSSESGSVRSASGHRNGILGSG